MNSMDGKKQLLGAACLLAAAALCFGQAKKILLRDKNGTFEISQYKSFNAKVIGENKTRIIAPGNPKIIATWSKEMLRLEAGRFEGTVNRAPGGEITLEIATLSGGVDITSQRNSANEASKVLQTIQFGGQTGTYQASDRKITIDGGFSASRTDAGAGQSGTFSGGKGTFHLHPQPTPTSARYPFKSALISGSVRIVLFGDVDAEKVILRLDAKGELDEIEVEGEPANLDLVRRAPAGAKPPR